MRCDRCGAEAPVLKTCRWRNGNGVPFALCDPCWLPISGAVWVVRGPVTCFGQCRRCSEWFSVRELEDRTGGGRWDSLSGVCENCAKEGGSDG